MHWVTLWGYIERLPEKGLKKDFNGPMKRLLKGIIIANNNSEIGACKAIDQIMLLWSSYLYFAHYKKIYWNQIMGKKSSL